MEARFFLAIKPTPPIYGIGVIVLGLFTQFVLCVEDKVGGVEEVAIDLVESCGHPETVHPLAVAMVGSSPVVP